MSRAQRVVPGQVIFASRMTLHRRFVLRPDPQTVHLFKYLLALYAAKYGIKLHACSIMSTHYHLLFTDVLGNRAEFFRDFHAALTRCLQLYRGLGRSYVFDKRQTNQVDVVTPSGIIEAAAYTLANPTEAGITPCPDEWPGNLCKSHDLATGKLEHVRRPDSFRTEDGQRVRYFDLTGDTWPEQVALRFEPVPALEEDGIDAYDYEQLVNEELNALVEKKRAEVGSDRGFGRVAQALRKSIHHVASQELPFGEHVPYVKAGRGQTAARNVALEVLRDFWARHAEAVAAAKAGKKVLFPPGTYRWAKVFGFAVAET
ncbi:MAG: hypothetical protein KF901_06790 [Myxococcales bacterium]|nr:hypothetical protein [Myxococcales bacterium]